MKNADSLPLRITEFDAADRPRGRHKKMNWGDLVARCSATIRTAETVAEYKKFPHDIKELKERARVLKENGDPQGAEVQRNAQELEKKYKKIKDVGGFVGGWFDQQPEKMGVRSKHNIAARCMAAIDIDGDAPAKGGVSAFPMWEKFKSLHDCAAFIYTTHSTTPERPRYRVLFPFSRNVNAQEYERITRAVCVEMGLFDCAPDELPDLSTFQFERLMFWASSSKDGEFITDEQKGEPFPVDEFLKTAPTLHELIAIDERVRNQFKTGEVAVTPTPRPSDPKRATRDVKRKSNPTTLDGAPGVFCSLFTLDDALQKFCGDHYEPAPGGKYTHVGSSSTGSVEIYDYIDPADPSKNVPRAFMWSFHAHDPLREQCLNAFEVVQLVKFADLDKGVKSSVKGTAKLPSRQAMEKFCASLPRFEELQQQRNAQRLAALVDDPGDTAPTSWRDALKYDPRGNLARAHALENISLFLSNEPVFAGVFRWDEMSERIVITRPLPWDSDTDDPTQYKNPLSAANKYPRLMTDYDLTKLCLWFERINYRNDGAIEKAVLLTAGENKMNPFREYLETLPEWDGVKRAETLFIDYVGGVDDELTRAVTRLHLCAAVERVRHPGCKYDYILTLQGKEGIGKTTIILKLGGRFAADSVPFVDPSSKAAAEQIQGKVLVEYGELTGMDKRSLGELKSWISSTSDDYRPAYGRFVITSKRKCVFFATTNKLHFLRGTEGNRRFWLIPTDEKRITKTAADITGAEVQQIWAEVVNLCEELPRNESGEAALYLPRNLEVKMRLRQKNANEITADPRREKIVSYLNGDAAPGMLATQPKQRVTLQNILENALGVKPNKADTANKEFVQSVMDDLCAADDPEWRWSDRKMKIPGTTQVCRCWVRLRDPDPTPYDPEVDTPPTVSPF